MWPWWPPAAAYMRPGASPQSRRYVFTGPGEVSSLVTDPPGPRWPPALKYNIIYNIMNDERSFSSVQTFHTHPAFGRVVSRHMRWKWGWQGEWWWDESEDEMKDCLTGTRGGERKRRGKKQTHTNTPGPEQANLERAREKKTGGRRTRNKTSGGGGMTEAPEPTWHGENLRLPRHAKDPTYLGREERMK